MGLTGKSHATASLHHHVTALISHLPFPCHQTSKSFDLPPATKPVSHLTCPLPPCHHVTMSVSHLPCPLQPNQSVICLAPCHQASQSFALPPATKPVSHVPCPLPLHHHITASVSHLPCPLPPNQSVICLAPCHQTSKSFDSPSATTSPHHRITVALCHCITTSVSHLPCPLPPSQSFI